MMPSFFLQKDISLFAHWGPFNQRCSNHWQDIALASPKRGLHLSYLIFSSCATVLLNCSSTRLQGSERHREECVPLLMFDLSLLLFAMISEGNCKSPILGARIIESFRCDEISKVMMKDKLQTEGQGANTLLLGAKKWDECDHKQLLERGRELAMPSMSSRAEWAERPAPSGSGRVVHAPKPRTFHSPPVLLPWQPSAGWLTSSGKFMDFTIVKYILTPNCNFLKKKKQQMRKKKNPSPTLFFLLSFLHQHFPHLPEHQTKAGRFC